MKKIVKLFAIIMVIVLTGCSNTETQETSAQKKNGGKVAFVTEVLIDSAIANAYNEIAFGREIIKSKSVSQSDSVTTTGIDASGNLNTHTTTKTTTKTKSKGASFGVGMGDY